MTTDRSEPEPCHGRGATFDAVAERGYQEVSCACGRRFNVRVVRSRNRVLLPTPTVTVPWHRAAEIGAH